MARFDGKKLKGLIGPVVLKTGKNGVTTVQTKPRHVPQTEESKKTASVMANASTLSCQIRRLLPYFDCKFPGSMVNRLSKATRTILEHCFDKNTETYTFQEDSFQNLDGFEFHDQSPVSEHLWVKPFLTLDKATMKIRLSIPAFEIPDQLKMPKGANTFTFYVNIGHYALYGKSLQKSPPQPLSFAKDQRHIPECHFEFDVHPGCLCVVTLGILYYKLHGGIKTKLNNDQLNPFMIAGTSWIDGEFTDPGPYVIDGRHYGSKWTTHTIFKFDPAIPES